MKKKDEFGFVIFTTEGAGEYRAVGNCTLSTYKAWLKKGYIELREASGTKRIIPYFMTFAAQKPVVSRLWFYPDGSVRLLLMKKWIAEYEKLKRSK